MSNKLRDVKDYQIVLIDDGLWPFRGFLIEHGNLVNCVVLRGVHRTFVLPNWPNLK